MPTNQGFGLDPQGVVPTEVLQAFYPYLAFGPNLAAQLANLQFGAGLDAQSQNNQLALALAQGAASNRLADNVASRLALQGFGSTPAAGSAFGMPVRPVTPLNLLDIFGQFNQGLSGLFAGGGYHAGNYTPAAFGNVPTATDALAALRAGNPALANYYQQVQVGNQPWDPTRQFGAPYSNTGNGFGGTLPASRSPRTSAGTAQKFGGRANDLPTAWGPKQGVSQPSSPFGDIQTLAGFGGTGGLGPSTFQDQALGIQPFGAPRATLNQFYSANPQQRQAQDYLYSLFGYDPSQLAYERAFYTPGARLNPTRAFGL